MSVYPDLRGASRLLLSGAALDLVNLGLRQLRRDGQGSEFARLRDYAQGDSVREVDWKATARRGRPVTRVMESERSPVACSSAWTRAAPWPRRWTGSPSWTTR